MVYIDQGLVAVVMATVAVAFMVQASIYAFNFDARSEQSLSLWQSLNGST